MDSVPSISSETGTSVVVQQDNPSLPVSNASDVVNIDELCPENELREDIFDVSPESIFDTEESLGKDDSIILSAADRLVMWAVKHKITREARNEVLGIMRLFNSQLPRDFRTLLGDIRRPEILDCSNQNGTVAYFGIEKNLCEKGIYAEIMRSEQCRGNVLQLKVHIDGLTPFHSSGKEFWPLLGQVFTRIFIIAIYLGTQKLKDATCLLSPFVEEFEKLQQTGLIIGDRHFGLKLKMLCADAPARALALSCKVHSGYASCHKCWTHGVYKQGAVRFTEITSALRTHEEIITQADPVFHQGISALVKLTDFDLVRGIPIDYMHGACGGVMKRLVYLWLFPNRNNRRIAALGEHALSRINDHISVIVSKHYYPTYMQRRPRLLDELKHFKATEFRQLLLYTGPVIFRRYLDSVHRKIFQKLHVAFRILCRLTSAVSEEVKNSSINQAEEILKSFHADVLTSYGGQQATFNVHSLMHLPEDCRKFGSPDNFSCFPFESFLGKLKNYIHTGSYPLQQVITKYGEYLLALSRTPLPHQHNATPTLQRHLPDTSTQCERFTRCSLRGWDLRADCLGNSFVRIDKDTVFKITRFEKRLCDGQVFAEGTIFSYHSFILTMFNKNAHYLS